jgi:hypothetical protein
MGQSEPMTGMKNSATANNSSNTHSHFWKTARMNSSP